VSEHTIGYQRCRHPRRGTARPGPAWPFVLVADPADDQPGGDAHFFFDANAVYPVSAHLGVGDPAVQPVSPDPLR
jgi:hypothetical protein